MPIYMIICVLVENWKPGKVKICCPLCNKIGRPAIKQTKKQVCHGGLVGTLSIKAFLDVDREE